MVLPALQVRVPNPANALLQAEQIKGARAQTRSRNALLGAFEGGIPTTREGRAGAVSAIAQGGAPLEALQIQQHFSQADAQEGQLVARAFVGVGDQASYDQARTALQQSGVDVAGMPPQFNPQFVQSSIQTAQSLQSLIAQQQPPADFTLSPGQERRSGATGDVIARAPVASSAPTPRTDLAKINVDLSNGLTTPAQALRQTQQALAPDETWRPMTEEERTAFNIPEGQGAQISSRGKASTLGSGGITIFGESGNVIAQIGGGPLTNRQQGAQGIEIADEIRQTGVRLSELSTTLSSLRRNPQAAGLSGILIENVGGVVEQISGLTGMNGDWINTRPVQETRTQLSSLLGQYIPTITGDTSGRYSDQDARRADAALPARRPQASFQQVEAALLTLQDVERRARARALMRLDGFPPQIDITYPEGRTSYAGQLLSEGQTPQQAANTIGSLMDKYEIPDAVEGIQ